MAAATTTDDKPTRSPWLTTREAAARAKCGLKLLYYAVKTGRLKAARLGVRNEIRIHEHWLDAWVASALIVNPDAPGDAADLTTPLHFPGSTRKKRR